MPMYNGQMMGGNPGMYTPQQMQQLQFQQVTSLSFSVEITDFKHLVIVFYLCYCFISVLHSIFFVPAIVSKFQSLNTVQ